ncbi:DUF2304 domain-containing protein [Pseudonocardia sp. T1-2H]|uniref:DUF2304 domain-containing protein n=1 Tax=Pseudonocardia sp. T1-2H TaxID=3128899 RepID=UPI003101122E
MPSIRLTIFSVVVAIAALVFVVEMLRRRRLREKYAVIWVIISIGTLVVAIFPGLLGGIAQLIGIQTPSNLLFFASLIVLFAVSLQLSREVGLLEEQSRRLAEEVGALRLRLGAVESTLASRAEAPATAAPAVTDAAEPGEVSSAAEFPTAKGQSSRRTAPQ